MVCIQIIALVFLHAGCEITCITYSCVGSVHIKDGAVHTSPCWVYRWLQVGKDCTCNAALFWRM